MTTQDMVVDAITTKILRAAERTNLRAAIEAELYAFTELLMKRQGWTEWPSG